MDFLKLIPQVFFDAIARVVPGAFCLVCLQATTQYPILKMLLESVAPNRELTSSSFVWILVVTAAAFVTGHFMAPFIRFLESPATQLTRPDEPMPISQAASDSEKIDLEKTHAAYRRARRRYLLRCAGQAAGAVLPFRRPNVRLNQRIWQQYDWLRLEAPEVGGLVARIRAEYTMYGGFAVALIFTLIAIVVTTYSEWAAFSGDTRTYLRTSAAGGSFARAAVATIAAGLMLRRHRDTYRTFGLSVGNFYRAAEGTERWKPEFLGPRK